MEEDLCEDVVRHYSCQSAIDAISPIYYDVFFNHVTISLLKEKEINLSNEKKYTIFTEDHSTRTQSFLNLNELKCHSGPNLLKLDSTFCRSLVDSTKITR